MREELKNRIEQIRAILNDRHYSLGKLRKEYEEKLERLEQLYCDLYLP